MIILNINSSNFKAFFYFTKIEELMTLNKFVFLAYQIVFMLKFRQLIELFFDSSIIIALVIIASTMVFYKLPLGSSEINYQAIFSLATFTWALYIFDRIFDNYQNNEVQSSRHLLHKKHEFNFMCLAISLCLISFVNAYFLKGKTILMCFFILLMVIIYYFLLKTKAKFYKELMMPLIFCFAVAGIPMVEKPSINASIWLIAFCYFIIVLQNVLLFSYFENLNNPKSENIITKISAQKIIKTINFCSAFLIFIAFYFIRNFHNYTDKLLLIFAIIGMLNALTIVKADYFRKNDFYRKYLDLLFLLLVFSF